MGRTKKRMVFGVYHSVSKKHVDNYLCSQSFRYDHRNISEWERFTLAVDLTQGKRITYTQLINSAV